MMDDSQVHLPTPHLSIQQFFFFTKNSLTLKGLNTCLFSFPFWGLLTQFFPRGINRKYIHVVRVCVFYKYDGGTPQKSELSSGGWAPYSTGFPHYVSVLGTHLYQCASWCCCERLRSASVNLFRKVFQHICPFHGG